MSQRIGRIAFASTRVQPHAKPLRTPRWVVGASSLILLTVFVAHVGTTRADAAVTYTVNSTVDLPDADLGNGRCDAGFGVCTLRAALGEAQVDSAATLIRFSIAGLGVHTIQLGERLPAVDDTFPTTIDGYSEPGATENAGANAFNGQILVEVRGQGALYGGLTINSGGNVVRGLAFYNLRQGVRLIGPAARNNRIVGNFIGTNAAATFRSPAFNSSSMGVVLSGASDNFIGTPALADRNVVSGNASKGIGLYASSDRNRIQNNIVGLGPSGARLGNRGHGIDVNFGSDSNTIGGGLSGAQNVVSGNEGHGIELSHGVTTTGNSIIGNFVGSTLDGRGGSRNTTGNANLGINLEDKAAFSIVRDNVVVANGTDGRGGIRLEYSAKQNVITNNRVGVTRNGTVIPNGGGGGYGIRMQLGATRNVIGPGNIVAGHSRGVEVVTDTSVRNTITRNSIYGQTKFGIDLPPINSPNSNDPGDADTGPNTLLNTPVLSNPTTSGVRATACDNCIVEVFIADRSVGSIGSGRTFLASEPTNGSGVVTVGLPPASFPRIVTATATDPDGNTSEFSVNVRIPAGSALTNLASDTFTRSMSNGWGIASGGGAWAPAFPSYNPDLAVNGTAATMRVPGANQRRRTSLSAGNWTDTSAAITFSTSGTMTSGSAAVYLIARDNTAGNYRLRITMSGAQATATVVAIDAAGVETAIGGDVVVDGLTVGAGVRVRARLALATTGTTTELFGRVWLALSPEPEAWTLSRLDATAGMTSAGKPGLAAQLSPSAPNTPVTFTFDDYVVDAV